MAAPTVLYSHIQSTMRRSDAAVDRGFGTSWYTVLVYAGACSRRGADTVNAPLDLCLHCGAPCWMTSERVRGETIGQPFQSGILPSPNGSSCR